MSSLESAIASTAAAVTEPTIADMSATMSTDVVVSCSATTTSPTPPITPPPNSIRLAFGSKARVGKDTACNYVKRRFGGVILRFADDLYELANLIQKQLGYPQEKDPGLLQTVGTAMRDHYGVDIWVNKLVDKYERAINSGERVFCVVDMRLPNEMARLGDLGFVTVQINRTDRTIDRDPTHQSEVGLDNATFSETIDNNYVMGYFYGQINHIILTYFLPAVKQQYSYFVKFRVVEQDMVEFGSTEQELIYNLMSVLDYGASNSDDLEFNWGGNWCIDDFVMHAKLYVNADNKSPQEVDDELTRMGSSRAVMENIGRHYGEVILTAEFGTL